MIKDVTPTSQNPLITCQELYDRYRLGDLHIDDGSVPLRTIVLTILQKLRFNEKIKQKKPSAKEIVELICKDVDENFVREDERAKRDALKKKIQMALDDRQLCALLEGANTELEIYYQHTRDKIEETTSNITDSLKPMVEAVLHSKIKMQQGLVDSLSKVLNATLSDLTAMQGDTNAPFISVFLAKMCRSAYESEDPKVMADCLGKISKMLQDTKSDASKNILQFSFNLDNRRTIDAPSPSSRS